MVIWIVIVSIIITVFVRISRIRRPLKDEVEDSKNELIALRNDLNENIENLKNHSDELKKRISKND